MRRSPHRARRPRGARRQARARRRSPRRARSRGRGTGRRTRVPGSRHTSGRGTVALDAAGVASPRAGRRSRRPRPDRASRGWRPGRARAARGAARSASRSRNAAVERSERLVEHQQPRRRRERPGERDALRLAARQRVDRPVLEAVEPDELEHLAHPLVARRRPAPAACGRPKRRCRRRCGGGTGRGPGTSARTRARARGRRVTSTPSHATVPVSGTSSPATTRSSVLLPHPLGPDERRRSRRARPRSRRVDRDGRRRTVTASAPRRVEAPWPIRVTTERVLRAKPLDDEHARRR